MLSNIQSVPALTEIDIKSARLAISYFHNLSSFPLPSSASSGLELNSRAIYDKSLEDYVRRKMSL